MAEPIVITTQTTQSVHGMPQITIRDPHASCFNR